MYRGHRIWKRSHGSCVWKSEGGKHVSKMVPWAQVGKKVWD